MHCESQNIEYKESWRDEYLKWICGFANAYGGKLFIGVDDKKKVVGVSDYQKLMEDIPNKVVNYLGIVVDVNLLESNGFQYIEIDVLPSNTPISYRGVFHYRTGSTKQELKGVALQNFLLQKIGMSWDSSICESATIDDIDRSAIDFFIKKSITSGRMSEDEKELSTEDVLSKLGLISNTGKLKNAAVVLFGRDINKFYSSIEFKIGRFHNSESNLITQDVIEGNVIEMAGKVMEVLRSKYLISLIEYKGEQRIERLEIPEPALREIIYNSIAHRDYQGASIQCRVYDDIIEIWNPGLLPEGLTPDTIFERHASYPRNKCIAYAFFKAGFIESWGRGYKKIEEELTKVNIEIPKVTEVCGGVLITINRKLTVDSTKPKIVGNNVGDFDKDILGQLSERQRHIYDIIRKSPEVTAKRMSVTLSVAKRTIERDLAYLTSKGILRREGKPNSGIWVLLV